MSLPYLTNTIYKGTFKTMKNRMFVHPPHFKRRLLFMSLGVIAMGFGLSILIQLNLGTDPCSCFTLGIASKLPISFGTCQLLFHLLTFAFVLRYDLTKIGYGTIGNMVFLGYITDFFTWIWNNYLPPDFFQNPIIRFGLLIPILAIFIIGAAAYMTAGLGVSPYDALPFIIGDRQKKVPFKAVRMIWDIFFMSAGFFLGSKIGVVTVLCAFFLGPVISWFQKKMEVLL